MVLGRWKNIHGAVGMLDMPLFKGGQSMLQALCPLACLCVAHHMSPVPFCGKCHGPHHGVFTCLSTGGKQSQLPARKLYNMAQFCECEPTPWYGNSLLDTISKLQEHYLSGPFQVPGTLLPLDTQTTGWGSQTASTNPTGSESELNNPNSNAGEILEQKEPWGSVFPNWL